MFCPKCGKINPDNEEKCTGCGAVLHEEPPVPVKKGNNGWKIVVAVVVVIAVAVVAAVLLSGCGHAVMPDINERITY